MAKKSSSKGAGNSDAGGASSSSTSSLRGIVQTHLLNNVLRPCNEKFPGWMVLVVDKASLRMVSSSIGMYHLMEHRVTIVEDLNKKRAPFRDQAVIYLIEPTLQSVSTMIEDWTPSREKKKGPPYGDNVFVYTLGRLPDELFGEIKKCKELVKRLKALGEVNLDFLTKEAMAFHFDMKTSFKSIYPVTAPVEPGPVHDVVVNKLVTVCATLNEYPHVRFPAGSELCRSLAFSFQQKMNEFVGHNRKWWYHGDGGDGGRAGLNSGERGTLVLLDRGDDCLSPLIHEFTYEAMVNDLLKVDDDRITYDSVVDAGAGEDGEGTKKIDALLNDNDDVWVELRGKHIADVIQILSTKIRDIVSSNSGSALSKSGSSSGKALSVNQMAKALKALPEYKEIMSKLSQHMQIAHKCMDAFNKMGLLDLSELEQTLATGKTDEGDKPKMKELLMQTVEQMRGTDDSSLRLRLLAILIVSQRGLASDSDLQKLLREADLSPNQYRALEHLAKMGCPLVKLPDDGSSSGNGVKSFLKKFQMDAANAFAQEESESEYSSSRYVCLLKATMTGAAEGTLSVEDFPSVMPLPDAEMLNSSAQTSSASKSVRKSDMKPSKWNNNRGNKKAATKKTGHTGGRQIFFVTGGMCYSELRMAREVTASSGTEIVVGTTRFINPTDFLKDLESLE